MTERNKAGVERVGDIVWSALSRITLDTSMEAVLTQRSVFNPYPNQAKEGMLVEFGHGNVARVDSYFIRYPATGKECFSLLPIHCDIPRFSLPQQVVSNPDLPPPPDLASLWPEISEKIVKQYVIEQTPEPTMTTIIDKAILDESVKEYDQVGSSDRPFHLRVYGNLMRSSIDLLKIGKWKEAIKYVKAPEVRGNNAVFFDTSDPDDIFKFVVENVRYEKLFIGLIETVAYANALEHDTSFSEEAREKVKFAFERRRQNMYTQSPWLTKDPTWYHTFISFYNELGIDIQALETSIGYQSE